jgi:hypothetical protein
MKTVYVLYKWSQVVSSELLVNEPGIFFTCILIYTNTKVVVASSGLIGLRWLFLLVSVWQDDSICL